MSRDVQDLAQRFSVVAAQISARIDADNAAMQAGREIGDPEALDALAHIYSQLFHSLARNPGGLAALPADTRATLRDQCERLNASLAAHQRVLGAFKELAEGLAQAAADEIARQQRTSGGYRGDGAGVGARATAPPIAIDRSA